jgi:hypothetical protein
MKIEKHRYGNEKIIKNILAKSLLTMILKQFFKIKADVIQRQKEIKL